MKKLISILFLFAMLLQAIPVLHFFMEKPEVFYTTIDEEKAPEKGKELKEKNDNDKAFLIAGTESFFEKEGSPSYIIYKPQIPATPNQEPLSPPPNIC